MSMPPTAMRLMRWHNRHRVLADSVLAALVLGLDTLLGLVPALTEGPSPAASWLPTTVAAVVLCTGALSLRRVRPVTAWATTVVVPMLHDVVIYSVYGFRSDAFAIVANSLSAYGLIGTPLCLTSLAMRRHVAWAWAAALVSGVPSTISGIWMEGAPLHQSWFVYLLYSLICVIATLIGMIMRIQEVQLSEMKMRSARLALAREQEALLAAANERSRIAREMHDVVAHSLAVMITMADGAAATVERNPAVAKQAMETLAEAGRSALADTRRLVGVLREDPSVAGAPATSPTGSSGPAASAGSGQTASSPDCVPQTPSVPSAAGISPEASAAPERPAPAHRSRWSFGRKTAASKLSAPSAASAPSAHSHEVRDVPVPEFAPLGTVTPVEPSAPIASLRQQATDGGGDRSQGDLPLAPAPEQADITELVKRFKAAGVPVSYRWVGTALPEDKSLQLTVFRIAQEALTNVLRYAPTTPAVKVDVERHIGTVILTVDNEAAPGTRPMHGSGKGLIGMRERASVYGGTVQAGPTTTGWRVRAVLRWDEHDEGTSSWQMPL